MRIWPSSGATARDDRAAKGDRYALVMVGVVLDRFTPESFSRKPSRLVFILDCHLVAGDFGLRRGLPPDPTV